MIVIIPKILHYCWMGKNEKSDKIKYCMESWRKYLSDWQIIEWNEDNFDLDMYPFAREAYERKRWAFVSDVVRLYCLYSMGGCYVDSDVEIIKSLDKFLSLRAFTGHETDDLLVTAIMGAEKSHSWIEILLRYYNGREYSERTNTQIITELSKPLIEKQENEHTYLKDGVVIFPRHYFCNFDHKNLKVIPHEDAYAYHHFCGSWTNRSKGE